MIWIARAHRSGPTATPRQSSISTRTSAPRCVEQLRGMFAFAIWDTRRRADAARARSPRHQAALLHRARRRAALRFGAEADPADRRRRPLAQLAGGRPPVHVSRDARRPEHRRRRHEARTRARGGGRPGSSSAGSSVTGTWRSSRTRASTEGELVEQLRAHAARVGGAPSGQRRAGRRVPQRRHRLERRRRHDGASPPPAASRRSRLALRKPASTNWPTRGPSRRQFGTDHYDLVLRPDVVQIVEDLTWYLDEPFGDTSAIPTYMVSKLAAEHVKVVLSGDGGDELFAGYDKYIVEGRERALRPAAAARSGRCAGAVGALMPHGMKGRRFLRHLALDGRRTISRRARRCSTPTRCRSLFQRRGARAGRAARSAGRRAVASRSAANDDWLVGDPVPRSAITICRSTS